MDIVEIPSHFMENFVYDARTLPLFMRGPEAGKNAAAIAQHVKQDQHLFGALDMELQVVQPYIVSLKSLLSSCVTHVPDRLTKLTGFCWLTAASSCACIL